MGSPIESGNKVCVKERPDLGYGEVLRVSENYGVDVADVVFETDDGRRLETLPVERLSLVPDIWERAKRGDWDRPLDFLLKQLAFQFPLHKAKHGTAYERSSLSKSTKKATSVFFPTTGT